MQHNSSFPDFHKLLQTKTWGEPSENVQSVTGTTALWGFLGWIVHNKHTYNYTSQNSFTVQSQEILRGIQAPRQTLGDNSFPISLTPKPFPCIAYVSALTFILPCHRGFPVNVLAKVDSPSALPAPATSPIPAWKGQSHSPEGGGRPTKGEIWPRTPWAFPFCFLILGFSGSWAARVALVTLTVPGQNFCFIFGKHFNCHSAMKVKHRGSPCRGESAQRFSSPVCSFVLSFKPESGFQIPK